VAGGRNEARLGPRRLLRSIFLRNDCTRRHFDAPLEFLRVGMQPRRHIVEARRECAEFATTRRRERRHAAPATKRHHRRRKALDRTNDAIANGERECDGHEHTGEAKQEPGPQQSALLRKSRGSRHGDADLPDSSRSGGIHLLRKFGHGKARLDDRLHKLD
jgi:hypothetical protein